jgi:hypothetical protein
MSPLLQTEIGTLREIAFWLGSLVIVLWAWRDLQRGLPENEMRYASPFDRYLVGALVYAGATFVIYYVVVQITISALALINKTSIQSDLYQGIPVSLVAVLVVIALLPELPVLKGGIRALRRLCRALALYPYAVTRFSKFLRRKDTERDEKAIEALQQELNRYGASIEALREQVSPGTFRDLQEVQSAREHLNLLLEDRQNSWRTANLAWDLPNQLLLRDRFRGALALSKLELCARGISEWNQPRKFRRFLMAREHSLQRCEQIYQKLLRQLAQVCALAPNVASDEFNAYPLSGPIVSTTDELLGRYRTLVSEAALSCFSGGTDRQHFIERLGYSAPPDWFLPYWPLLAVFLLDAALFLAPLILGLVPAAPPTAESSTPLTSIPSTRTLSIKLILPFLFTHGIAPVVAVSWAILPKTSSNFARPSLFSYPWRSYLLFGLCSLLTGMFLLLVNTIALNYIIPNGVPRVNGINPYKTAVIFSIYFPMITVCVSLLTDLHLRSRTFAQTESLWRYRVRDAVVAGVLMASVNVLLVRQAISYLSGLPSMDKYYIFAFVVGGIGFSIGFLVPATAAAYLHAAAAIRPSSVASKLSSREIRRELQPTRTTAIGKRMSQNTKASPLRERL